MWAFTPYKGGKPMNHPIRKLIVSLSFTLVSIFSMTGCAFLKGLEKSCDVTFEGGEPFTTTHVTTFSNGLTPHVLDTSIPSDHKFFGWTALDPENVHYSDPNFEHEYVEPDGIVRYDDIKNQVVNGKVTMRPLYIHESELPINYLVVGWYAKTETSGLGKGQMDKWTVDLTNYLTNVVHATSEQLSKVIIRPYNGNVAAIGAAINKDGDVDIFLGANANLATTGKVAYVDRQSGIMMGGISRYIFLLSNRSVARTVYDWSLTDEGHASLA